LSTRSVSSVAGGRQGAKEAAALAGHVGDRIRSERRRRRWTIRELARRAGLSPSLIGWLEAGNAGSLAAYAAVGRALGLRAELDLVDPRRRGVVRDADPVHAAMGEALARGLARTDREIALDEPYQHYQFAGRGDVVAWSVGDRALLHVENRTRFPNLQEAFGSYNAKRRWLAASVADRVGLHAGFESVTHAIVALWSSEVLHSIRMREASFRAVCPDGSDAFERWWYGRPPLPGANSTLVVFDPIGGGRSDRRRFVGLDEALRVRGRYTDYVDAASRLRAEHMA
jgi:transcriptional regulator with XRE-family HTH domain